MNFNINAKSSPSKPPTALLIAALFYIAAASIIINSCSIYNYDESGVDPPFIYNITTDVTCTSLITMIVTNICNHSHIKHFKTGAFMQCSSLICKYFLLYSFYLIRNYYNNTHYFRFPPIYAAN